MFEKYVVNFDDDFESIALKFQTTVDVLKDINNLDFDSQLRVGSEIVVPKVKDKYFDYYVIEKGDNLYQISLKYNINPELLASINGLEMDDYIYPGQELLIPKSGYSYYITTLGDTLDIVANRFKISKNDLLKDNETIYLIPDQLLVNKNR